MKETEQNLKCLNNSEIDMYLPLTHPFPLIAVELNIALLKLHWEDDFFRYGDKPVCSYSKLSAQ
jgi:hypothetical protein